MKKPGPVRISRKNHIRLIVSLLVLLSVAVGATHRLSRLAAPSCVATGTDTAASRTTERIRRAPISSAETDRIPDRLELPAFASAEFLIRNKKGRFTLMYDTTYRQAAWVAYLLTRREVQTRGTDRKNVFRCDPEVVARGWPTATDKDYAHSGFDRGHLLPSADRNDSSEENGATFYLSNISPQRPGLNRRLWRLLEEQVRRWAVRYDSLYIVTGGELGPSLPRMKGSVGIPGRFFKAILVRHGNDWHAAAFLIPNEDGLEGRFFDYMYSVDRLEEELGMDFFPALPDRIENRIEAVVDRSFWK